MTLGLPPLEHNVWTFDLGRTSNPDGDQTGTRALQDLVNHARPAIGRFPLLPADCDARIRWSADSDSTQGGFVISTGLAANILELGVDVYATVYLEDSNSAE